MRSNRRVKSFDLCSVRGNESKRTYRLVIMRRRLPPVTCPSKVKGRVTSWQWAVAVEEVWGGSEGESESRQNLRHAAGEGTPPGVTEPSALLPFGWSGRTDHLG